MAILEINWHPAPRELRTFGLICAGICIALSVSVMRGHGFAGISVTPAAAIRTSAVLAAIAATSAALAWLAPAALRVVYLALTMISAPIGFVVSYLLLAALFFLVLTPYGLAFRLLGRDGLARRLDRTSASYWLPRPGIADRTRYFRQY